MNPLVSIIIPVYNGEGFLREAVDSILQQNYRPLEIVIVDDGSTDGTAELAKSFGKQVRYIYQSNKGPAAARNSGIAAARGEFIAFLDADDLWPSHKLNKQIPYLTDDPNLEVIMGHTKCFGSVSATKSELKVTRDSVISVQLGSAVFRKSVFEKVGLFDEELSYSEDHDWFLRAREQSFSMLILEDVTLYHRRHERNLTASPGARGYQLTKVLKKSLDRRREQNDGEPKSLPKLSDYFKKETIQCLKSSKIMANLTTQTDVSVIIPVYNGELYLTEAIESVLSQSYPPSDVIVVDDGSTDRSAAIAKRYGSSVRYFCQKNMGTAAARNRGINEARGSFLAFLDQDDVWELKKLEMQVGAFQEDPELEMVVGYIRQFYSPELEDEIKLKIRCPEHPEPGYLPSAMLIKRDSFLRVGLFETEWQIGEWTNWYVRALEVGIKTEMLSDMVARRRIHSGNKGILQRTMRKEYVQILKASLDRRRAEGKIR